MNIFFVVLSTPSISIFNISTAFFLRGGWSGVGVGEAGLNRIVKTALSQRG
ncbi:hypothetical protein TRIP_D310186 [uncultured Paludibacter sp.]|nr:hypothetical protein TRIP_D310186 [uncultured Paludibacter sp.]